MVRDRNPKIAPPRTVPKEAWGEWDSDCFTAPNDRRWNWAPFLKPKVMVNTSFHDVKKSSYMCETAPCLMDECGT